MIKELRAKTGLSQVKFGEYLDIPRRTIENWESGTNTPPDYLVKLIESKVNQDYKKETDLESNIRNGNIGGVAYFMRRNLEVELEGLFTEKGLEDVEVLINYDLKLREKADDVLHIEIRSFIDPYSGTAVKVGIKSIDIISKTRFVEVIYNIIKSESRGKLMERELGMLNIIDF